MVQIGNKEEFVFATLCYLYFSDQKEFFVDNINNFKSLIEHAITDLTFY